MRIISMTIMTSTGGEVEIAATPDGALITHGNRVIGEMRRTMDLDSQLALAVETANIIQGTSTSRAENTLIINLWHAVQQVAGF